MAKPEWVIHLFVSTQVSNTNPIEIKGANINIALYYVVSCSYTIHCNNRSTPCRCNPFAEARKTNRSPRFNPFRPYRPAHIYSTTTYVKGYAVAQRYKLIDISLFTTCRGLIVHIDIAQVKKERRHLIAHTVFTAGQRTN